MTSRSGGFDKAGEEFLVGFDVGRHAEYGVHLRRPLSLAGGGVYVPDADPGCLDGKAQALLALAERAGCPGLTAEIDQFHDRTVIRRIAETQPRGRRTGRADPSKPTMVSSPSPPLAQRAARAHFPGREPDARATADRRAGRSRASTNTLPVNTSATAFRKRQRWLAIDDEDRYHAPLRKCRRRERGARAVEPASATSALAGAVVVLIVNFAIGLAIALRRGLLVAARLLSAVLLIVALAAALLLLPLRALILVLLPAMGLVVLPSSRTPFDFPRCPPAAGSTRAERVSFPVCRSHRGREKEGVAIYLDEVSTDFSCFHGPPAPGRFVRNACIRNKFPSVPRYLNGTLPGPCRCRSGRCANYRPPAGTATRRPGQSRPSCCLEPRNSAGFRSRESAGTFSRFAVVSTAPGLFPRPPQRPWSAPHGRFAPLWGGAAFFV